MVRLRSCPAAPRRPSTLLSKLLSTSECRLCVAWRVDVGTTGQGSSPASDIVGRAADHGICSARCASLSTTHYLRRAPKGFDGIVHKNPVT
ncbi:hypothetical protein BDW22DRAFT_803596 [Trametopsis cervina]|nr:hypothetical protein BDW22DRAFT_803596 [Trametopsis cervina]